MHLFILKFFTIKVNFKNKLYFHGFKFQFSKFLHNNERVCTCGEFVQIFTHKNAIQFS